MATETELDAEQHVNMARNSLPVYDAAIVYAQISIAESLLELNRKLARLAGAVDSDTRDGHSKYIRIRIGE